jgi:hypothetical protein
LCVCVTPTGHVPTKPNTQVYDMGVMIPCEKIIEKAIECRAQIIGLSGAWGRGVGLGVCVLIRIIIMACVLCMSCDNGAQCQPPGPTDQTNPE